MIKFTFSVNQECLHSVVSWLSVAHGVSNTCHDSYDNMWTDYSDHHLPLRLGMAYVTLHFRTAEIKCDSTKRWYGNVCFSSQLKTLRFKPHWTLPYHTTLVRVNIQLCQSKSSEHVALWRSPPNTVVVQPEAHCFAWLDLDFFTWEC